MKLFAPKYYKDFACIKGDCKNSCCIGWEIEVDEATLEKYGTLPKFPRENILKNLNSSDGRTVIATDVHGRCPFLTECGLCEIISTLGEEYTSVICRRHPRFYNFFTDRCEVGLGVSCEAAARLVLSAGVCYELAEVGEILPEGEASPKYTDEERSKIFAIISEGDVGYEEKISSVLTEYDISREDIRAAYDSVFPELELLRSDSRELLTLDGQAPSEAHPYLLSFFAYLVYRHIPGSASYENLRARVGFAVLLTEIMGAAAGKLSEVSLEVLCDIAAKISEEIEYSEDNTEAIIFEIESII